MRVLFFIFLFSIFSSPVFAENSDERKILYWHDPMYPATKFDKPGKSPFMDMDLVPVYEEENGGAEMPAGAIKIDSVYRQALGVKTGTANLHTFGKSVHAFGHLAPSTRLEYAVDVRTAGWIVDLATDAVGDTVKKGDLLFTYYSPDLMTAQSDFLIGARIGNAAQRLRLYGMDDKAIAELRKKGRFMEETPFYAPADGTVSMLNARKGMHIEEGDTVLMLQDYSKLWVTAHLPLRDMQFIAVETPATVTVDETGEKYQAVVDFIHPVTDPQSRNGMVRLVLDNPDGKLKTDTLVNVMFEADSRERLAVPEEAVLYGGSGAYVIEALGDGYFQPVMVKPGITAHGMTEIISGVEAGRSIVTSGQFMIDAESNLQGGMAGMGHDHGAQEPMQDMEGTGNEHKH